MLGFSTDHDRNKVFNAIVKTYIKIHLGALPFNRDEFMAAVSACQLYYLAVIKDNKELGLGHWTLPMVHMLRGHMIHVGLTLFAFSPLYEKDQQVMKDERKKNSKQIWINGKKAKVESRDAVINEYDQYLVGTLNKPSCLPMPADQGAPGPEEAPQRSAKRPRRSMSEMLDED